MAASAGCLGLRPPGGATYRNPVFGPSFPDPTAIRVPHPDSGLEPKRAVRPPDPDEYGGTFYAYATAQDWWDETPGDLRTPEVPILRSENLVDWTFVGEVFASGPDWKAGNPWAPDVAYHDGRFLLYYSLADWGDPDPGIGVATAADPAGPFTDHGEVLRSGTIGVPNSIDPMFLVHEGRPHLVWGSFGGLHAVELTADGLDYVPGTVRRLAGDHLEGAYVIERNDRHYLFASTGSCCEGADSTYRVVVGRADAFAGPYRDRAGVDLRYGGGTTVLEGRVTLPGDDERFVGPGHNCVVRDDAGDDFLLYHAYDSEAEGGYQIPYGPVRRLLMLDRIDWSGGWPTVGDGTPSAESVAPTVGDGLL